MEIPRSLLAGVLVAFLFVLSFLLFTRNEFLTLGAYAQEQCVAQGNCADAEWTFCGCTGRYAEARPWYGFFAP